MGRGLSVASNGDDLSVQQLVEFENKGVKLAGIALDCDLRCQCQQAFFLCLLFWLFPLHGWASERYVDHIYHKA
jgi:hypothetical protein